MPRDYELSGQPRRVDHLGRPVIHNPQADGGPGK
jgi:hypothetical protein